MSVQGFSLHFMC